MSRQGQSAAADAGMDGAGCEASHQRAFSAVAMAGMISKTFVRVRRGTDVVVGVSSCSQSLQNLSGPTPSLVGELRQ